GLVVGCIGEGIGRRSVSNRDGTDVAAVGRVGNAGVAAAVRDGILVDSVPIVGASRSIGAARIGTGADVDRAGLGDVRRRVAAAVGGDVLVDAMGLVGRRKGLAAGRGRRRDCLRGRGRADVDR